MVRYRNLGRNGVAVDQVVVIPPVTLPAIVIAKTTSLKASGDELKQQAEIGIPVNCDLSACQDRGFP
jgi:hypothetical protein